MKIIECEQLSEEWFEARRGIPTSSSFDKIVTSTGAPSKQKTKYMYRLAGEKISGRNEDMYQSKAMERGVEVEEEARDFYQVCSGKELRQVGFCLSEEGYGASPDCLVDDDGSLEIKCPLMSTQVEYLLDKKLPVAYFQQTQGHLLVTGRKWVDFLSYYPGLQPVIVRVGRDEEFLAKLRIELTLFCNQLNELIEKIKWGKK